MKEHLTVKIFTDFKDPLLKKEWQHLQESEDVFPQMYYQWIATWWNRYNSGKKLYIITIKDAEQNIVGIAPFCIIKQFGVRILQSIPIHFGDFYEFIGLDSEVIELIIAHTKSFKKWNVVEVFNNNNESNSFPIFLEQRFESKRIVEILTPKFESLTFDEFLKTISKNSRNQYKRKLRRLEKEGDVNLVIVDTWDSYMDNFEATKDIYNKRWERDYRPLLSEDYYRMRNEALKPLFEKQIAIMYLLQLEDDIIAFRLGFLKDKTFYDWKVSHDPKYNYYSPGFLTVGLIIKHLISTNNKAYNFMTGNYQYKRSWTNNDENSINYELLYAKKFSIGQLYLKYRKTYRDRLKLFAIKLKRTNKI